MLVIGNGESRNSLNIAKRPGLKVGCNAIYRDMFVDHLVCVDRRMVSEAISKNYNETSFIYTRKNWISQFKQHHVRTVPDLPYKGELRQDDPFQWGSGPYAVLLGAKKAELYVELVGFDLYGRNNKVNNVYKDTDNYDNSDKRAVDPRYWIHQIGKVFECFPKKKFIVYQEDKWILPETWNYGNVFLDRLNNFM